MTNTANFGVGKAYDDLKTAALPAANLPQTLLLTPRRTTTYKIPVMAAGGTGYPFPIHTNGMLVEYAENGTVLSRYNGAPVPYPGDDWPNKQP